MASGKIESPFPSIKTYSKTDITWNSTVVYTDNPDNQFTARKYGHIVMMEGGMSINPNLTSADGSVLFELPEELAPTGIFRGWFMNIGGSVVRYGGVQYSNGKAEVYMNSPIFTTRPYMFFKIVYLARTP